MALSRAGPRDLALALAATYPQAQRAACPIRSPGGGYSLISLNGFSRKPVGLLSGLLTP